MAAPSPAAGTRLPIATIPEVAILSRGFPSTPPRRSIEEEEQEVANHE
jgi:hypothetical protein